jgi:hypothetical protein
MKPKASKNDTHVTYSTHNGIVHDRALVSTSQGTHSLVVVVDGQ